MEFGFGVRRYAPPSGPVPINAGPFPSNTRGAVTLLDNQSTARIAVKLSGESLALTSKNPHSRISTEYRLYNWRETNLTSAIASADWVQ